MKNLGLVLILILITASCAEIPTSILPSSDPLRPVDRLSLGMLHAQAAAIMDSKVVVGFEIDPVTGLSKPVEAKSLYASEIITVKGVTYQVDRYIVHAPGPGVRFDEADLFPLVYKDGLLVAKGYEELTRLKAEK